jgi:hypothetical protein
MTKKKKPKLGSFESLNALAELPENISLEYFEDKADDQDAEEPEGEEAGWYWNDTEAEDDEWEPHGPFDSEEEAHADALAHHPKEKADA